MSARRASPADVKVQELQRSLYRAAKADPGRRFHALYDKVHRRDVLEWAWEQVARNRGAAGVDRVTLGMVEQYGVSRLLDELAADLREERLPAACRPAGCGYPSPAVRISARCRSPRSATASCKRH